MEDNNDIEFNLKSEPMNEMLSHPPKWIVRSGSGIVLILILVFVALGWFIQYPDEISGEVVVTTSKAPIELTNQGYVQLKSLDVHENEQVHTGDIIAQFDIQANTIDIQNISSYLHQLAKYNGQFDVLPIYNEPVRLGTFQESWTKLNALIVDWNTELQLNASQKQITSIQREIDLREQLQSINEERINISADEYSMIKKELESSERLAEQNAISKQTLVTDKRTYSQALQTIQNQKEQKVQNLIAINSLKNQLEKLKHDTWTSRQQKSRDILIGITSLQSALDNWEKNAVWIAPCSGKIVLNTLLQENRYYKANEASVVVVPNGSGYSAIASVEVNGAGKIKPGQKVFIELTDYPQTEFGMLEGTVERKTQIDKEGKYEVQIKLPRQLITTYKKQIPYKARFNGKVKIITKNKRVLTRIFEQLTDLLK